MNASEYLKGRGAQINPNNKFFSNQYVQEHVEGLDEEFLGTEKTQFIPTHPKSIISKSNSPDLRFERSINPYQGCEHGCIYCYARNSHEYWGFSAGLDFERKILVKHNAAQLLEQEFRKSSYQPDLIMLSGNTDCYQPIERKLGITRSLLELMVKYQHPVSIISKNILMRRDFDLLRELAARNLVSVAVTINSLREEVRQKMEPRTATASARLKLIEGLTGIGVPVMLMMAPIVPGINSDEISDLIRSGADAGAITASYTIVRLNGQIGGIFKDWLYQNYPDRAEKVLHWIEACHGGKINDTDFGRRIKGDGHMAESLQHLFKLSVKKYMNNGTLPSLRRDLFRLPDAGTQLGLF
ncbi:PA0069 family radical SAM protein [Sphingobacterium multivorum]|uniref:PA0069 family radical SAM protein n=1 Tax=Sphingobacterium multivorum TaxID=28454 RepID=A0ABX7CQE4_SPHMU|nr:PA0069 family radical SAM protein [Sphingobacterium multivorum]QQT54267.1 PA0069 family radical SAM protein [Sphingobacterium multivorum]